MTVCRFEGCRRKATIRMRSWSSSQERTELCDRHGPGDGDPGQFRGLGFIMCGSCGEPQASHDVDGFHATRPLRGNTKR